MLNREAICRLFRALILAGTSATFAAAAGEEVAKSLKPLEAFINVPEPASYVLLGSGLVVLSLIGRARHRRQ
jgi:hypothetical protein